MTLHSSIVQANAAHYPNENFLNRELGILAFNRRVLSQAKNPKTPLLERLRFLCIVSSNLDEFFEIRAAGVKEQVKLNSVAVTVDGLTAHAAYRLLSDEAHALVEEQYALLNGEILPKLADEGIQFICRSHWSEAQLAWIKDYFFREVMPVLTPIGLDPSHPFPRVLNISLPSLWHHTITTSPHIRHQDHHSAPTNQHHHTSPSTIAISRRRRRGYQPAQTDPPLVCTSPFRTLCHAGKCASEIETPGVISPCLRKGSTNFQEPNLRRGR